MLNKENRSMFYGYFALCMLAAYIGRNILQPNSHGFHLHFQLIAMLVLPYLYKSTLTYSKFISGALFFVFFVLMFEVANFIPIFGLTFSVILYKYSRINLGIDWAFDILRPIAILAFIYYYRNSFFLFFSALSSNKEQVLNTALNPEKLEAINTVKKDKPDEVVTTKDGSQVNINGNYYTIKNYNPTQAYFYFNELSQIVSIFFKNSNNKNKYVHFCDQQLNYLFLDHRKNTNPHINNVRFENNVLTVYDFKEQTNFVFECAELIPSIKQVLENSLVK